MLEGLRIVDTTRLLPGPFATWLLAAMGADVIKIEPPGGGDHLRAAYPRRDGTATAFHLYNAGKRSVVLNLKRNEGREAFLELVRTAEVVLESNRPGVMDRLGCGWDICHKENPNLVYCAITGFGQTGPYAHRAMHDGNALGYAGVLSEIVDRSGRPVMPGVPIADSASGLAALGACLAGVLAARAGGGGRFVDISMTDLAVAMNGMAFAERLFPGEPQPPGQHDLEGGSDDDMGVYETADARFIALNPYENRFKELLWSVLAAEGVGRRPPPGSGPEILQPAIAAAIRQRTRARWDELLGSTDACYSPVYAPAEVAEDPQVQVRRLIRETADGPRLASPIRSHPQTAEGTQTAPRLGEHTQQVLSELGWSNKRIAAAQRSGAITLAEANHI